LRVVLIALCWALSIASAQTRDVVALAHGEAPFLVGGTSIPGDGNVFDGESVSSYYLPTWIDYLDGARYALGIGSAVRLTADRIHLEGVSLEIVSAGSFRRPIRAASMLIQPTSDCQATVYTDRPDTVTVHVTEGSVEVYSVAGLRIGAVSSGSAATFSYINGQPREQRNRGPLEMARILLRELNYTFRLEAAVPPFGRKRRELSDRLVDSTNGVLMLDADVRGFALQSDDAEDEDLTIDPDHVRQEAAAVSREIHHSVGWSRYGCGKPSCMGATGIAAGNPFGGDARLIEAQPSGCLLCEADAVLGK
jgi:hypothetical protein